jgi:hypothetical protein
MSALPFILPVFLLFLQTTLPAQVSFDWSHQFGSVNSENPGKAFVDADGNVYMMAEYSDTIDMDPGPQEDLFFPKGTPGYVLSKLNKDGGYLWTHSLYDKGSLYGSTVALIDDRLYIGGFYQDTLFYENSNSVTELSAGAGLRSFLLILNPDGEVMEFWTFAITSEFYYTEIIRMQDGSLFVAGTMYDTIYLRGPVSGLPEGDGIFFRLSPAREVEWYTILGSTGRDYISDIDYPGGNLVYFSLVHEEWMIIQTTTGNYGFPSNGEDNSIFGSIDLDGLPYYVQGIAGEGADYARSIAADQDGNMYVTGQYEYSVNFAHPLEDPHVVSAMNHADGFVAKYNPEGSLLWVRTVEDTESGGIHSIQRGHEGHLYMTGQFAGAADLDPGDSSTPFSTTNKPDMYLMKMDPDGNMEWVYTFPGNDFEGIRNLSMGSNGRMHAYGYFYNQLDVNPLIQEETLITTYGGSDIFISAFTEEGIISSIHHDVIAGLSLYPNPASQTITIQADEPVTAITIYDLLGNIISSNKVEGRNHHLQLPSIPGGTYIVEVRNNAKRSALKIVHVE